MGAHFPCGVMGFVVESCDVSAEEYIGHGDEGAVDGKRFDGEDIKPCRTDLAGLERADQGWFVNQRSAGSIDDDNAGFHFCDAVVVDHVPSFGRDGEVQ